MVFHCALSRLGWVAGGPQSVVEALLAVVGSTGTLVAPSQSGQLTDPANWSNPPVPPEWVEAVREALPAYDPYLTPTRDIGQVVECLRQHRATLRSAHPTLSFVANGPLAASILEPHALTPGLGEGSPLSRLYELDAKVLLLGVGYGNATALHLAEHRASWPSRRMAAEGVAMVVSGERRWVTYEDLDLDSDDFDLVGAAFVGAGLDHSGRVGNADARWCPLRALVDFGATWMSRHRS